MPEPNDVMPSATSCLQEVKLQERVQCRQAQGGTPKSLTVLLQDELAGAAHVGGKSPEGSPWLGHLQPGAAQTTGQLLRHAAMIRAQPDPSLAH